MKRFEVVFEIEVVANTPKQAATMVRDALLDPNSFLLADVHPIEWLEAADDYIPNRDKGWQARFDSDVRPSEMIEWVRHAHSD